MDLTTDNSVNQLIHSIDTSFNLHKILADGSCFYCSIVTAINNNNNDDIKKKYNNLISKYGLNDLSFNKQTDDSRKDVLKLRLLIFLFGLENRNNANHNIPNVNNYDFTEYDKDKESFIKNILEKQADNIEIKLLQELTKTNSIDLTINIIQIIDNQLRIPNPNVFTKITPGKNNILLIHYNMSDLTNQPNHYALISYNNNLILTNDVTSKIINNINQNKKGGKSRIKINSKKAKKYRKTKKYIIQKKNNKIKKSKKN